MKTYLLMLCITCITTLIFPFVSKRMPSTKKWQASSILWSRSIWFNQACRLWFPSQTKNIKFFKLANSGTDIRKELNSLFLALQMGPHDALCALGTSCVLPFFIRYCDIKNWGTLSIPMDKLLLQFSNITWERWPHHRHSQHSTQGNIEP